MWIVIKYKPYEIEILKNRLKEILGNEPEYYLPIAKYTKIVKKKFKIFKKSILDDYLLCFHSNFKNENIINILKTSKGIVAILHGFKNNQNDIINFINTCKSYQDKDGFISKNFFRIKNFSRGQFISGPFTNLFFDVVKKHVDKIEVAIGKYRTTIPNNKSILYKPI